MLRMDVELKERSKRRMMRISKEKSGWMDEKGGNDL